MRSSGANQPSDFSHATSAFTTRTKGSSADVFLSPQDTQRRFLRGTPHESVRCSAAIAEDADAIKDAHGPKNERTVFRSDEVYATGALWTGSSAVDTPPASGRQPQAAPLGANDFWNYSRVSPVRRAGTVIVPTACSARSAGGGAAAPVYLAAKMGA